MPAHSKAPTPKCVDLWEAIRWIAYGEFHAPIKFSPDDPDLLYAEDALYRALRDGQILAFGIKADFRVLPDLSTNRVFPYPIAKHFWNRSQIFWDESRAGKILGYKGITIGGRQIMKFWPQGHVGRRAQSNGPGRPRVHNEVEFLRYCVWEAAKGQLPIAGFKRRMLAIMSIVNPSDPPQDTWVGNRLRDIYRLEEKYKRAR